MGGCRKCKYYAKRTVTNYCETGKSYIRTVTRCDKFDLDWWHKLVSRAKKSMDTRGD
jgi:hypothetical protein